MFKAIFITIITAVIFAFGLNYLVDENVSDIFWVKGTIIETHESIVDTDFLFPDTYEQPIKVKLQSGRIVTGKLCDESGFKGTIVYKSYRIDKNGKLQSSICFRTWAASSISDRKILKRLGKSTNPYDNIRVY